MRPYAIRTFQVNKWYIKWQLTLLDLVTKSNKSLLLLVSKTCMLKPRVSCPVCGSSIGYDARSMWGSTIGHAYVCVF
eukprot:5462282-Amphidinium_carterae.1